MSPPPSPKSAKLTLDSEDKRILRALIEALTGTHQERRAMMLARAKTPAAQAARPLIIDGLKKKLHGPDRALRQRAFLALAGLGWDVLGHLIKGLRGGRSPRWRLRCAETLADVGPGLGRPFLLEIYLAFVDARGDDPDQDVVSACARGITALGLGEPPRRRGVTPEGTAAGDTDDRPPGRLLASMTDQGEADTPGLRSVR